MYLVFSWFADAGAWPEHPGTRSAVLDQEVVGPLRLLDQSRRCWVGRPDVPAVQRIAVYRRKMRLGPEILVEVLLCRSVVGCPRTAPVA